MTLLHRTAPVAAWLALSLAGSLWLAKQQLDQLQDRFFQDSSIALRQLGQKTAQNEATLATLSITENRQNPADLLTRLQAPLPQLSALGYWDDARWHGAPGKPAPPPELLRQARQQARVLSWADKQQHYWLQSPSGWAMRINPTRLLQGSEWPASLTNATLQLHRQRITALKRPQPDSRWAWRPTLTKTLPGDSQPIVLHSQAVIAIDTLPWSTHLLWIALSAALVFGVRSRLQIQAARRREREQHKVASLSRLGALGEMAAGIAHELNQPLTAIIANVGAAERLLPEPEEAESVRLALRTSVQQAKRAAEIVQRLRQLVTQRSASTITTMNPEDIARELLFLRRQEMAELGIALHWRNQAPDARPQGDQVALEQILHNLLQNACDALLTRPGPRRIELSGGRDGQHYRFIVDDNGPGIAAELLPRLFAPFVSTRIQGLGLGLALCETLAGAMDARLTLVNRPEGGARAELWLPLAPQTA